MIFSGLAEVPPSQDFSEKDYDTARRISAFCLLGSIFFGIAVAVLMLLFQTPILHLLGARDDTIAYAGAYYRFLVLGCPAIIFNIVPGICSAQKVWQMMP